MEEPMKIERINIPAAGFWSRDCELLCLSDCKGFKLIYRRDEDDTYWSLECEHVVAYKVITEEFSSTGYLINIPVEGAVFEVTDSPWIQEFGSETNQILSKCRHYILQFYDETIEIIAKNFIFKQLKEPPIL